MMLLQQMLQTGDFSQFIDELGQIMWQEKANEQRWDFWLHRVYDRSFEDYVNDCEAAMQQAEASENVNIETTVKTSFEMMENFHPE